MCPNARLGPLAGIGTFGRCAMWPPSSVIHPLVLLPVPPWVDRPGNRDASRCAPKFFGTGNGGTLGTVFAVCSTGFCSALSRTARIPQCFWMLFESGRAQSRNPLIDAALHRAGNRSQHGHQGGKGKCGVNWRSFVDYLNGFGIAGRVHLAFNRVRWTARLRTNHMCVEVLDGCCWIVHNRPRAWDEARWSSRRAYSSFRESLGLCLPEVSVGGAYTYAGVPLWLLFALAAIPTVILWRRDRRRIAAGHCRQCGYNLTGNESGKCPECATPVPKQETMA